LRNFLFSKIVFSRFSSSHTFLCGSSLFFPCTLFRSLLGSPPGTLSAFSCLPLRERREPPSCSSLFTLNSPSRRPSMTIAFSFLSLFSSTSSAFRASFSHSGSFLKGRDPRCFPPRFFFRKLFFIGSLASPDLSLFLMRSREGSCPFWSRFKSAGEEACTSLLEERP